MNLSAIKRVGRRYIRAIGTRSNQSDNKPEDTKMASKKFEYLSQEDVEHFMKNGYVRLHKCFDAEKAASFTENVWTRLGMDPKNETTWDKERINMPSHKMVQTKEFAPRAWGAICELLGGEDRVQHAEGQESGYWKDSLIVNLGTPEWKNKKSNPADLDGWHVDGDFFVHYLDSPEQGLLVIPVFTDIIKDAGGTMIVPEGIGKIAQHLYDHPEGVMPRMQSRTNPQWTGRDFYSQVVSTCSDFHEMTGEVGDVILMHPLMIHSASRNVLRIPRIITNPPVSLVEPFKFDRENEEDFSVVELKTIKELGAEKARSWKATGPREYVVPERLKAQNKMKEEELERLAKLNGTTVSQTAVAA